MKLTGNLHNNVSLFGEIELGSVFVHNDKAYVKGAYNGQAVYGLNLETGELFTFPPYTKVSPREVEVKFI